MIYDGSWSFDMCRRLCICLCWYFDPLQRSLSQVLHKPLQQFFLSDLLYQCQLSKLVVIWILWRSSQLFQYRISLLCVLNVLVFLIIFWIGFIEVYLVGRTQLVTTHNYTSRSTSRVPQGSHLGPIILVLNLTNIYFVLSLLTDSTHCLYSWTNFLIMYCMSSLSLAMITWLSAIWSV